jgi:hypothetical protein
VTRNGITFIGHVGTSYDDYGFLVENCVISETGGCLNVDNHGQALEAGYSVPTAFTIIRNNLFRNNVGTGVIVFLGNSGGQHDANYRDCLIENNIFTMTDNSKFNTLSPAVIYASSLAESCSNVYVLNNTFYNIGPSRLNDTVAQLALDTPGTTGNVLINNVWEKCHLPAQHRGFGVISNNAYFALTGGVAPIDGLNQKNGVATAFVNAPGGDFRILADSYVYHAGLDEHEKVATDYLGRVRGPDWDIGAVQYESFNTALAGPSNLRPK